MALSYLSIIPKFLWTHVIDHLPSNAILKMIIVTKNFDKSINDNGWRRCFHDRCDPIAIVRCKNKYINNFWYHAYHNYIRCDDIDDAFSMIVGDNKIRSKCKQVKPMIYYKVFFKTNKYDYNCNGNVTYETYNFNYTQCSVELIGVMTTIISSRNENNKCIICPHYFSIKNITIHDVQLIISKSNNVISNAMQKLDVYNCVFENDTTIGIKSINDIIIYDCKFDCSDLIVYNNDDIDGDKSPIINCTITHNTFINNGDRTCINIDNNVNYDPLSKISIINNITKNSTILYEHDLQDDTILFVDGNISV